jgi:hypothetical protein
VPGKTISFGALGSFTYGNLRPLATPPQNLPPPPKPMSSKNTSLVYKLTKDEFGTALLKWASLKYCKTKKCAQECHLVELNSYNVLEVF